MSLDDLARRQREKKWGNAFKVKLTAIVVHEGIRYERNLAQHFMHVQFDRIFPPRNETVKALEAWANKTLPS